MDELQRVLAGWGIDINSPTTSAALIMQAQQTAQQLLAKLGTSSAVISAAPSYEQGQAVLRTGATPGSGAVASPIPRSPAVMNPQPTPQVPSWGNIGSQIGGSFAPPSQNAPAVEENFGLAGALVETGLFSPEEAQLLATSDPMGAYRLIQDIRRGGGGGGGGGAAYSPLGSQSVMGPDGQLYTFNRDTGQYSAAGINTDPLYQSRFNLEKQLGLGGLAIDSQNVDLGYAGLDVTQRGQDITQRGQDLDYSLGNRGLDVTQRGQDVSLAQTQAELTNQARIAAANLGFNYDQLAEQARQFGISEDRLNRSLAEQARQFNVSESRLATDSATNNAVSLGRLGIERAQQQIDVFRNPADVAYRMWQSRGGESPLGQITQADILNSLQQQYQGIDQLMQSRLAQAQQLGQQQPTVGQPTTQPGPAPQPVGTQYLEALAQPIQIQYPDRVAAAEPAPPRIASVSYGGAPTPLPPKPPPMLPPPIFPPAPSSASPGGTVGSYGLTGQVPHFEANEDGYFPSLQISEQEQQAVAANANQLYQPQAGQPEYTFEIQNGSLVAIPKMASGGYTNSRFAIVGDTPNGLGPRAEMLVNPTGAPIGVVPNHMLQKMNTRGVSRFATGTFSSSLQPPNTAMDSWMQQYYPQVPGMDGPLQRPSGTSFNAPPTNPDPNTHYLMGSSGSGYSPESGLDYNGYDALLQRLGGSGMQFLSGPISNAVSAPPLTQQQLIDNARAATAPGPASVLAGQQPSRFSAGLPQLPTARQLGSLSSDEQANLNTRLATEFNTTLDNVYREVNDRFGRKRERPRARLAVA